MDNIVDTESQYGKVISTFLRPLITWSIVSSLPFLSFDSLSVFETFLLPAYLTLPDCER